jgi:uncharacterized beta-barrel protein YwiB (DUF1934 family)
MECKVRISSFGSDWSSEISAEGKLERGECGNFKVLYNIDGDSCVLSFVDEKVFQQRSGKQNLKLEFAKDKATTCQIGEGDLSGYFDIFTTEIKIVEGKGGIKLTLCYINGNDNITLNFIVIVH